MDAARGLALVGMFATHILPLSDARGETLTGLLADGRSSALFAVLAGVGVALTSVVPGRRPTGARTSPWPARLSCAACWWGCSGCGWPGSTHRSP
jgi:hypothetical protein